MPGTNELNFQSHIDSYLNLQEQTPVKFESKYKNLHSRKWIWRCLLQYPPWSQRVNFCSFPVEFPGRWFPTHWIIKNNGDAHNNFYLEEEEEMIKWTQGNEKHNQEQTFEFYESITYVFYVSRLPTLELNP